MSASASALTPELTSIHAVATRKNAISRHTQIEIHRYTVMHRHRERYTNTQIDRDTQIHTERDRDRARDEKDRRR